MQLLKPKKSPWHLLIGVGALTAFSLTALADESAASGEEDSSTEMSSPALFGYMVSQQVGLDELGFSEEEKDEFLSGFKKGLDGGSMEAIQDQLPQLQQFLQTRAMAAQAKAAAELQDATAAFVEDLESDPDVVKDDAGFYYEIIEEGEGDAPSADDQVVVNYEGALIDGTVFDSSFQRGEPATFPMGGVIPGFSGGLSKIGEGGKVRIYIPAELGYGSNPPPQSPIPPNAFLIFDAEIVDIVSPE